MMDDSTLDVFDTPFRRWKSRPDPARSSETRAATQPKAPPPKPGPPWLDKTRMRMNIPPGGPYEMGDEDIDAFNRKRHMGGPDEDDPYPEGYSKQAEFDRLVRGAYNAGLSGDDGAAASFPTNTPLGKLMMRAFREGKAARGTKRR